MYYIYGLTTTEHDKLIYIGVSKDPEKRLAMHISSRNQQDTPLKKRLYSRYDDIGYMVLSTCDNWRMALDIEKEFILSYLDMGHPLLNKFHTPAFKQELIDLRKARTEYRNSPEQVEYRAGMGRLLSVWRKCRLYKLSQRKMSKMFPFFKKADSKFYLSQEQYDIICRELPTLIEHP
jgi:predicted GIY-YIG superfamily endonuclease